MATRLVNFDACGNNVNSVLTEAAASQAEHVRDVPDILSKQPFIMNTHVVALTHIVDQVACPIQIASATVATPMTSTSNSKR